MSKICQKCGLVQELCVCESIAKEEQKIRVFAVKRRFGKLMTIVKGISEKDVNVKEVSKKLKSKLACGGTVKKGGIIELQGDHKTRVKEELVKMGFKKESIE